MNKKKHGRFLKFKVKIPFKKSNWYFQIFSSFLFFMAMITLNVVTNVTSAVDFFSLLNASECVKHTALLNYIFDLKIQKQDVHFAFYNLF